MVQEQMIPHPSLHWNEILAAYADGEFEGRDDLALLRQRVEDWLARHPEAAAELAQVRQLKRLWQETTPPGPAPHAWHTLLRNLERTPIRSSPRRSPWTTPLGAAAVLAASIAIVIGLAALQRPLPRSPAVPPVITEDDPPFPVAAANEVEVLNVEGADTHTLVVGELPLQGPLELASPGDVTVTSVEPAARDNMLPEVRVQGPGRPMIWARLESD